MGQGARYEVRGYGGYGGYGGLMSFPRKRETTFDATQPSMQHSMLEVPRRCAARDDAMLAWLGKAGVPTARPYTALAARHLPCEGPRGNDAQ